ncbi:MAG: epoxyqueuosine reductase, partial [Enterococcus faecalis]|nr:epoxyqueuosine reductase [Enterococcus faecalis]
PEQSLEALNYLLSVETEEEVIEEAQKAIYLLTSKKGSRSTE